MTVPQEAIAHPTRRRGVPSVTRGAIGQGVWVLSWTLVAAGLVLALVGRGTDEALDFKAYGEFFVLDAIIAAIYGPAAAVVLRRSRHPVGWIFAAIALGFAISAIGIEYTLLGAAHDDLPAYALIVQLGTAAWLVGAFSVVLVLPWILDRVQAGRAWALAARGGIALTIFAFCSRMLIQIPDGPPNPIAPSEAVSRWAADIDAWIIPFYFLYGVAGVIALIVRYRRASVEDCRGLAWVIVSLGLVTVSYICFEVGLSLGGPLLSVAATALFAAQVMLPTAIFVLVVRQPLWGLDLAVSRATMWGLLTAVVVAGYVVLVWIVGTVLPVGRDGTGILVVALLALAVSPVRGWVQRRVERLVYGSASDTEVLLSRLGTDVSRERPGQTSLEGLVEGIRRSMRLRLVRVESRPDSSAVCAVAGEPGPSSVSIPLLSQGREVGSMEVAPRAGERLDVRTLRLLDQIAGLVAVALELAQVNRQLDTARSRIVDVRHEERRLLRRELHDGLGPALAGASLALAAIDNNNRGLSAADSQLLGQLQVELARRSDDVRDIARALLPPALDEGRLVEALDVLASRFTDTRFVVTIDAVDADEIDTRRQIAVYYVAAEAVANAHRHAGARECAVRVEHGAQGPVTVTVGDDGTGIGAQIEKGIGMTSMRERATELGGTFSVTGDGGTTIRVVLP